MFSAMPADSVLSEKARGAKTVEKEKPVVPLHPAACVERSQISAPWTESGSLTREPNAGSTRSQTTGCCVVSVHLKSVSTLKTCTSCLSTPFSLSLSPVIYGTLTFHFDHRVNFKLKLRGGISVRYLEPAGFESYSMSISIIVCI